MAIPLDSLTQAEFEFVAELVRKRAAIVIEAGKEYDAIVVGATRQPWYRKFLYGNIPEIIAKNSDRSVILVKRYNRVTGLLRRAVEE